MYIANQSAAVPGRSHVRLSKKCVFVPWGISTLLRPRTACLFSALKIWMDWVAASAKQLRMGALQTAIALVCGIMLLGHSARAQTNEFRAFWADAFGAGFKSATEVTTFINNVRAANANAIVPEIRKRGD